MDKDFFLIQKMKNGNEAAMEKFVRKYYPVILKYCKIHVSDAGHAQDLTQETFEHFFRALSAYRPVGKTANYLYRIAGNLCTDYYRKKKEILMDEPAEKEENLPQKNPMHEVENRLDMEEALQSMTPEYREVLILFYFQERKLREIADILDIGLPLVKYRLKKAKEQLGRFLGEEDEG